MGLVAVDEPFARLFTQGMLVKDGAKMSKSKGNVVPPDDYYERYGADAIRLYELFIGPPTDDAVWTDQGVEGTARFLDRVWRMGTGEIGETVDREPSAEDRAILGVAHRTLRKVTADIDRFSFNTAVAALMSFSNELQDYLRSGARTETFAEAYRLMLLMLAPMAPHLAHELWERTGGEGMLAVHPWPAWDADLAREDTVTMVLQVNGKVRDRVEVDASIDAGEAERVALASPKVQAWVDGKPIRQVIARPPRLVNVVV
jgi:leucyl-tRNA synthetase